MVIFQGCIDDGQQSGIAGAAENSRNHAEHDSFSRMFQEEGNDFHQNSPSVSTYPLTGTPDKLTAVTNNPSPAMASNSGNNQRFELVVATICPMSKDKSKPRSALTMRVDCAAKAKKIL